MEELLSGYIRFGLVPSLLILSVISFFRVKKGSEESGELVLPAIFLLVLSIFLASGLKPIEGWCLEVLRLIIISAAAFGGAAPAKYFVGLLDTRVRQDGEKSEDSEKYTLKGKISVLNLDATLEKVDKNSTEAQRGSIEAKGGGLLIGVFERLAVVLCLIFEKESLFTAILAVKGLARYSDIKSGAIESEKFIVGTSGSMLWAAGCAILIYLLRS